MLGGVRVVLGHRGDDGAVLGDHLHQIAGLGQAQPPDAVEVALGALAERPRDLVAAEVAQRAVQVVVEDVEAVVVGGLARGLLAADDHLEAGEVLVAHAQRGARGRPRTRAPRARTARRPPRSADAGHEGPELRHDLDQPVVAQALQRLADRRAADAEQRGQLVLGELAAGLELRGHDRVAQEHVDLAPRAGCGGPAWQR